MKNETSSGISFGSAFAMVISYAKYHSLAWLFIHGIFGWIYVFYFWYKGY